MAFICLHNESIYEMQNSLLASERGTAKYSWRQTIEESSLNMLNWLQFILSSLLILPVSAAPWRAADQARARPSTGHPRHTGPVLLLGATQQLAELLELY